MKKRVIKRVSKTGKSRDIFSREKRSQIMAAVKGKDTLLEKRVFSFLKRKKIRFKTHYLGVIGKPDIVVPRKKKAIFIDSDFWHGWQYPKWKSKLTSDFWVKKIDANRKRDRKVNHSLRTKGWKILRIWEHQIEKNFSSSMEKIIKFLKENE
jgi:DNA mismatch endonuclease (patch repair protein)